MPWEKTPEPIDEVDLAMTGALPAMDDSRIGSTKSHTPARTASGKTQRTRSTRKSERQVSPSIAVPASTHSPAAAYEEPAQEDESIGYGDLSFSSFGSESPAHGTRPPSAIKVGATPAHEASILALTNFKRRPRQPSLLRMVQQTTDVEDNDQSGPDDTDNFDFDDFLPEAESTPLNVRRNAPEDEARNDSGAQIPSSGSRGVKRKLSPVVQVPRSSPPVEIPSRVDESELSRSPSLPEILPTREETFKQTQDNSEPLSETYAPPMSSSPIRKVSRPVQSPTQTRTRQRRNQRKTPMYDESDAEETETPAKTKRNAKSKAQQSISTAQLKSLLPRRRNRNLDRDEFDIESSEATPIDSDQDELQMPQPRRRQPTQKATKKGRGKKAAPRVSRTYSRRVSSDKENDHNAEAIEEPTEASILEHSSKLAAIRKKFEEVDAFELDFETVDATTSSSPFR